jgi:hypothetical protein
MEENKEIPDYVFNRYNVNFETKVRPNIVRTKNITSEGINLLVQKNNLLWSNSIYDNGYLHIEGIVWWGSDQVFIYFQKIEGESTYKLYILTEKLILINMLLIGLNKFFTIDKI